MGLMFPMYAIPVLSLAFVVWAVATRRLSNGPRRATMVATILLACGVWALVRTDGITGEANSDLQVALDADCRGTAPGPRERAWRSHRLRRGENSDEPPATLRPR